LTARAAVYSGAFWAKQRLFRPAAYAYYCELMRSQYLSADELAALNWRKRVALVRHAVATVPYYRTKFAEMGLSPDDLREPDDWRHVPLLTRADVIECKPLLVSETARPRDLVLATTGGTSGTPLAVYGDRRHHAEALLWRMLSWWHLDPGVDAAHAMRLHRISRSARWADAARWWPTRRIWLNASCMTPTDVMVFLRRYGRLQPALLQGYSGAIHHLASVVEREGLLVHAPRAVWVTASPVPASQRALIARTFRAPVYDQYGSCEVLQLAAECAEHSGLHVNSDARHIEFLDDEGGPCAPGQLGRVAVTDLENNAFPLIRYLNGDLGHQLAQACPCGRTLPLMGPVAGRVSDIIRLPDGSALDACDAIFDVCPEAVRAFQVVQEQDYSIVLRVVPNPRSPDGGVAIARVHRDLIALTRSQVPVRLEAVENIESDRGKLRYIISHVE
jgi:phenylacetate-CoA ligase